MFLNFILTNWYRALSFVASKFGGGVENHSFISSTGLSLNSLLEDLPEKKEWVKTCVKRNNLFKNGPSKICGRQPLQKLEWYGF